MLHCSPFLYRLVLFIFFCCSVQMLHAQQQDTSNPFELVFRMDRAEKEEKKRPDIRPERDITPDRSPAEEEPPRPDNPDKQAESERSPVLKPAPEAEQEEDSTTIKPLPVIEDIIPIQNRQPLEQSKTLLFVFFVIQLILLTFAVSLERSEVHRLLRAMANDNYLNLVHRDLKGRFPLQYWVFYVIFIAQLSLFLWLCFQYDFIDGRSLSFWICLFTVLIIYLVRHISMKLIAYIFPVERESKQFNFTIAVFNMLLGLFLLPVNAFIAFAAPSVAQFCIYLGLVLIFGFYILRQLRGLFIASEYVMFHRVHFFLYLCTVEIAPVVVLIKFYLML